MGLGGFDVWGEEEDDHPRSLNIHMDAWATLADGVMSQLLGEMVDEVLCQVGSPNRRPRIDLLRNVEAMVSCIVANLVLMHRLRPSEARLAVPLANTKKTKYDRKGFQKLSPTIDALASAGLIEKFAPKFKLTRTTIRAVDRLYDAVMAADVKLSDVVRADGQQNLVLTARPPRRYSYGNRVANSRVDYLETAETQLLRAEIDELNGFLSSHTITLRGEPSSAFSLWRNFTIRSTADPEAFRLHGRLYGGFWMILPEAERQHLRINGEPVADLDFSAMFPSLAYIRAGHPPPDGDPYAIRGLETHRGAAKAAMSALLSSGPLRSLPPRVRDELPAGWTLAKLRKAVIELHPILAGSLEQDLSLEFMFTESRILMTTLLDLMRRGIPALPMHDGMMVPSVKADLASAAMRRASLEVCGQMLGVTQKSLLS